MNIVEKPITDLITYESNPKIHTEKQIQQIMKSITLTHGLRQPIVIDADNVVVCGHGRLIAAQKLGMVSVPCELVVQVEKQYRLTIAYLLFLDWAARLVLQKNRKHSAVKLSINL